MNASNVSSTNSPVEFITAEEGNRAPETGIAICLSGGGYRAMLFHVGAIWRLYETGLLRQAKRISSVSGGSITSALIALRWQELMSPSAPSSDLFISEIARPIRALAGETIDASAIVGGLILPGTISDRIQSAYRKHLFDDKTLQDFPDEPRFVINATNVQSAALWRFMKPYMRDYRVGEVKSPNIPVATAVAASSAFPPVLSPLVMEVDETAFTPASGQDLQEEPFTSRVVLTDGGVYDNLGLETAWKRYSTILVSDAGGKIRPEAEPKEDWARHAYRVLEVIDNQVRSLRKRQLIDSYIRNARDGAYWGIRTNVTDYGLDDALPCPHKATIRLAEVPTRLKRLSPALQEQLINWGYAVCDAALRRHFDSTIGRPADFPYPAAGLG